MKNILTNDLIIIDDICGNFNKFFEPLKRANIISKYEINETDIKYSFPLDSKPIASVAYLGNFIYLNSDPKQLLIYDALVDICMKYPDYVMFVLGNYDVAECGYFLDKFDLQQLSTASYHIILQKYCKYSEIMTKFVNFLKTRHNLLKLEFLDFEISNKPHYEFIPPSLKKCISDSSKIYYDKYFTDKAEFESIKISNDRKKIKEFIINNYLNYVNYIKTGNTNTGTLFDEYMHNDLNSDYYYDIFARDLLAIYSNDLMKSKIIKQSKIHVVGQYLYSYIKYDKKYNLLSCCDKSNSWLVYSKNDKSKNEKYSNLKHIVDKFYEFSFK